MKEILITGSAGLIGSQAVRLFIEKGFRVIGIDNNTRGSLFGHDADTNWNRDTLKKDFADSYIHYQNDIRDKNAMEEIFKRHSFGIIIHAAGQPSHDQAAKDPIMDFEINAYATLLLLELFRKYSPGATFIFTSSSKVYGGHPNDLPLIEEETRYELPKGHPYENGIDETMSIDGSLHSLYDCSKASADLYVQTYARYFGLNTVVFRPNCMTGPAHSGTEAHGFLSYLVKCIVNHRPYKIFGYKGKQVRDNIHSSDLVNMFWHYYQNPHKGEVYNVGGGRDASISILEAIKKIEDITKLKAELVIEEKNRIGDHKWYISNNSKFMKDYPKWNFEYTLDQILEDLCKDAKLKCRI